MKASDIKPGTLINVWPENATIFFIISVQDNPWEPDVKCIKYIYDDKVTSSYINGRDIEQMELVIV